MDNFLHIPENNRIVTETFEEFETGLYKAMHRVKLSFFEVGYWLYHANDKHDFLPSNGYSNIAEYAYEKFGLSKSTTYDLIKVYRRFKDESGYGISVEYIRLSQSQLVALSRMKYTQKDFLSKVKPTDTVSDIEKAVQIYNTQCTKGNGIIGYSDIKEYIELSEKRASTQTIKKSRRLEKDKAEDILNAIQCTKRTYGELLKRIQDAFVWTSEIRNIFLQIESNFTKLERAINNETISE